MPQHVAVVFVHGIFASAIKYSEKMQASLLARLPRELRKYVTFEETFWAGPVRSRQLQYIKNAKADADIVDNRLRRFFIEGMGDAAAYQKTRQRENSIYFEVQREIATTLKRFDPGLHRGTPLIFIGHSLGTHIISSFIWDLNKLKQRPRQLIDNEPERSVRALYEEILSGTPLCRLDTLAGLITLGSNIPLFTFTFGPSRVFPITRGPLDPEGKPLTPAFPGAALPPALFDKARWLNFYSKRDVLGYPVKPLNDFFGEDERIEDIAVETEWWYTKMFPYWSCLSAHTRYWINATVLDRTAAMMRDIIDMPASLPQPAAAAASADARPN